MKKLLSQIKKARTPKYIVLEDGKLKIISENERKGQFIHGTNKKYTFVIGYHEDIEPLTRMLDSLYSVMDEKHFEVILVQDGGLSTMVYDRKNIRHIKQNNQGIGAALTKGGYVAKTEQLILCGADLKFNEGFKEALDKSISKNSVTCFACSGKATRYGAKLVNTDLILQAEWLPKKEGGGIYNIPCVLGACYLVSSDWFKNIRGFEGHMRWGSLEPLISIKSYMAGGYCKINSEHEVWHEFGRHGNDKVKTLEYIYHNQMLLNSLFEKSRFTKVNLTHPNFRAMAENTFNKVVKGYKGKYTGEEALEIMDKESFQNKAIDKMIKKGKK